jgi:hypothetical protein
MPRKYKIGSRASRLLVRRAHLGRIEEVKRNLLRRAYLASVADLRPSHRDWSHAGLDRALRPMAMTHDAATPIRQLHLFPDGDEGVCFSDQRLASIRRAPSRASSLKGSSIASG